MLILASESASRRAMLTAAGVDYDSLPARIDETAIKEEMAGASVRDVATRLAELKAIKISISNPKAYILGSDSMLQIEKGRWLDKPGNLEGLRTQLMELGGRSHQLISAAAIAQNGKAIWRHVEVATLTVRNFSEKWLDSYIERCGPDVLSSVGGYHIEALGAQLFTKIEGDQFVVRGLPLLAVLGWLREAGELEI